PLPADTPPSAAAQALRRLGDAVVKIDEANVLRARRQGIRRDMERYAEAVRALVEAVAPDLDDLDPAPAAAELEDRLTRARERQTQREEKLALRERLRDRLRRLGEAVTRDDRELGRLTGRLGAGSPEELERLLEQAARLRAV